MANVSKLNINGASYDIKDSGARTLISQEVTERTNQIAALQSSVGGPRVAATASAMTDKTKVYVYTGSETGYVNGDWYFHDGSSWRRGGTYNSTAISTDKTLSVVDVAADAKIVGSKISDLDRSYEEAFESNVIMRYSDYMFETNKGTWTYVAKTVEVPSGTAVLSLGVGEITFDVSSRTSTLIGFIYKTASGSNIGSVAYFNADNCQIYSNVPSDAAFVEARFYTNTSSAQNTRIYVKDFYIIAGYAADVKLRLSKNVEDGVLSSNALIYYKNKTFTYSTKSTWQAVLNVIEITDDVEFYGCYLGSATYSNTELTSSKVRFRSLDSSRAVIGSADYLNTTGIWFSVYPKSGAKYIEIGFMINTNSAVNTSVSYTDFYFLKNSYEYNEKINSDAKLGDVRIGEFEDITSAIKDSKNLFTSKFKRGSLSGSSGNFSPSTTTINSTATEKFIEVEPSTTYTFSWRWNPYFTTMTVMMYDENRTWLGDVRGDTNRGYDGWTRRIQALSFETTSTTRYIRINIYSTDSTAYSDMKVENPQLEIGNIPSVTMATKDISYAVDYEKVRNNNLTVPEYYFANSYLPNKLLTIRDLMFDAAGNFDAFFFVTDTHWEINQGHSPALIRYLMRGLPITRLFHGGDVYSQWGKYYQDDCLRDYRSAMGKYPIYCVPGNHEYKGTYMDDQHIWYFLNATHDNIVVGSSARNYYYVDNQAQKMRYICLNGYASNNNADATPQFEQAQRTWLTDTALNVQSGWTILIFLHAIYDISITTRQLMAISGVTTELMNIVDSYNGAGTIAAIIQGHTHIDRITHTTGGIPIIITTCDKNGIWTSPDGYEDIYEERQTGTIAEQAIDVFVINKTTRTIYVVRVGSKAFDGLDNDIGSQVEMRTVTY